jgi:hypothetical protein
VFYVEHAQVLWQATSGKHVPQTLEIMGDPESKGDDDSRSSSDTTEKSGDENSVDHAFFSHGSKVEAVTEENSLPQIRQRTAPPVVLKAERA